MTSLRPTSALLSLTSVLELLTRWLLLPLGMVLGYVWARRHLAPASADRSLESPLSSRPSIADDAEQAIAAVDRAAAADPAALELQFSLGSLFRNRGEVQRAIAVHQRLLQRAELSEPEHDRAEFELAQDYQKAGLMDRAEMLIDGLCSRGRLMHEGLPMLLHLYEQAHDWIRAIDTARRLQAAQGRDARPMIAHYRCELAEQARAQGDLSAAMAAAEQALDEDQGCVRASLLLGTLAEAQQQPERALRILRRVPDQDPRFIGMVLPILRRCCDELGASAAYAEFIDETEQRFPHASSVRIERARRATARGEDGSTQLAQGLQEAPAWQGFIAWLDLQRGLPAEQAQPLRAALLQLAATRPAYRCTHCGLVPAALFWQCPRCRHWGSVGPTEN